MKKFIALLAFTAGMILATSVQAQHTTPRFSTSPSGCNNGSCLTYKLITVTTTSATTVAYEAPNAFFTVIKVSQLQADLTDSMSVKNAYLGDRATFLFSADGSARTVTFGNNMKPSATLVVDANQRASCTFIFDGVYWMEEARAKE